jgi:hypothetical protein
MNKETKKVEEKGKGKLNKFPSSLIRIKDNLILHRLVNDKKGKSFERLENYKFSTTIENSWKNSMNKDDYDYNTNKLKTIYSIDLGNLKKENKLRYLDTINLNLLFLKDNNNIPNYKELLSLNNKALEEVNKL